MLITIYNTNFTLHRHNLHNFGTDTYRIYNDDVFLISWHAASKMKTRVAELHSEASSCGSWQGQFTMVWYFAGLWQ